MISLILVVVYNLHFQVKFPENSLKENIGAFVHALLLAKPAGLKKSEFDFMSIGYFICGYFFHDIIEEVLGFNLNQRFPYTHD